MYASVPSRHRRSFSVILSFVAGVVSIFTVSHVSAATLSWQGGYGDWMTASNWGGVLPTSTDSAWIVSGTATIAAPGPTCSTLTVDSAGGPAMLNMNDGNLSVASNFYCGNSTTGACTQSSGTCSGGANLYIGNNSGSSGSYYLSGGAITLGGGQYVGNSGTGSFTQTGGCNASNAYWAHLYVGDYSTGNYSLSGGSLALPNEDLGPWGTGTFTQSGGTNSISSALTLAAYWTGVGTYNLSGTGLLSAAQENVGAWGPGTITQTGGTNSVSSQLSLGGWGSGTYTLAGAGLLSATKENVGSSSPGTLMQSGGSNSTANLSISNNGRYLLAGGTLQIAPSGLYSCAGTLDGGNVPATLSIAGSSIVDLSQGKVVNTGSMAVNVGPGALLILPSSTTTLNFGGVNNAGLLYTRGTPLAVPAGNGFAGTGTIGDNVSCQGWIQALGGAIGLSGGLNLAGTGAINLGGGPLATQNGASAVSGGLLVTGNQYVGQSGTASFTQSGGTNSASSLFLGCNSGSSGEYCLSGSGQLSAANEYVAFAPGAAGLLSQSAGMNSTSYLSIGSGGSYLLAGGTVAISGGMAVSGTLDGGGGPGTISIASSSLVDLSQGTYTNTGSMSVSIGTNSLLVLSSTMNPASLFGTFSNAAMTHTAGTSLSVSAGTGFAGTGAITDPVDCRGWIKSAGGPLNLVGGLSMEGSGNVNLGSGTLTTDNSPSTLSGGSLFASYHCVGVSATGAFTQSGGVNTSGNLLLGYNPGSCGTYNLNDGTLSSTQQYVGYSGTGIFTQSGGANPLGYGGIYLGLNQGSNGIYNLTGGSLWAARRYIGYSGTGAFTQSGGAIAAGGTVYLGYYSGGNGTYNFSAGSLTAATEYVGYNGTGTFTQSGGTNSVGSGSICLGNNQGSNGKYYLSAGSLAAATEYVGYNGAGAFTQTGGTNSVPYRLILGYNSSSGTYSLNGGLLAIGGLTAYGGAGLSFNFSGGVLRAANTFSTNVPMSFAGSGGEATFDTAGYTLTLSGSLSGPGGLAKVGSGTLVLAAPNTYAGDTTISAGTLQLANALALQNSTVNLLPGGVLYLNGYSATLGGLGGNGNLVLGSGTIALGNNSVNTTYAGQLSGKGSLKKIGSGILELTGSNGYSGTTTVNAGTLIASTTDSLPNLLAAPSNVTVAGSATLGVAVGGAGQWDSGSIDLLLAEVDVFATSANFGFDTSGGSFTYDRNISSPTLGIAKFGANALVLSGANCFGGNLVVNGGTLQLTGSNSYGGNTLVTAGTLVATTTASVPNLLAGAPSATVAAGATLVLPVGGPTGYTGANIATMLSSSGMFASGANLGLDTTGGSFACNTKNGLGIIKQGPNLLVLGGSNSLGGNFSVGGGTLQLGSSTAMPGGASVSVAAGAAFDMNGFSDAPSASPGTLSVQGGTFRAGTAAYGDLYFGAVTMTGGTIDCSQAGDCWLHLGGTSPTITTSAASDTAALLGAAAQLRNDAWSPLTINVAAGTTPSGIDLDVGIQLTPGLSRYFVKSGPGVMRLTNSGNTAFLTVAQGALRVDDTTLSPLGSGLLTIDGGTLLYANTAAFGSTGKGIALGTGGGTIDVDGNLTLSGGITGAGQLVKTGPAKLVLSGSNSFSGGLIVNGGTLEIANVNAIPSGTSLTVGAAAAFRLSSEPDLDASATLAPVSVPEPGTLSVLFAGATIAGAIWRRGRRIQVV